MLFQFDDAQFDELLDELLEVMFASDAAAVLSFSVTVTLLPSRRWNAFTFSSNVSLR